MKTFQKILPAIVLIILIAAFVLAQPLSALEYFKNKSSTELKILIFTESDNLYPALNVLNSRGDGAILVVDTTTNKAAIIEKVTDIISEWKFRIYREDTQDSFLLCAGTTGFYVVPPSQRTSGSKILFNSIPCGTSTGTAKYTATDKKIELTKYAVEIKSAYGASSTAITLTPQPSPSTIAPLTITTPFIKDETKEVKFSFTVSMDLPNGFVILISNNQATKDNAAEEATINESILNTTPMYSALATIKAGTVINDKISDDKIKMLKEKQKGKYLVFVDGSPTGANPTVIAAELFTIESNNECTNITDCMVQLNKQFLELFN